MGYRTFIIAVSAVALAATEPLAKIIQVIQGYEVTYPAGRIGGASPQGLPSNYVKIPPAKEYYLDYQVMFMSDFEWVKGGKLPGLVGGSHTSGCNSIVPDGWSARFMWVGGGRGEVYLYNQDRSNRCGDNYGFSSGTFVKSRWHRISEHVVINSPGQNNGLVEAWLDGKKVNTLNNVQLRGRVAENVALVDWVSLQTFYGGSTNDWAPPRNTHARFAGYYVRDDLPDFTQPFEAPSAVVLPMGAHAKKPGRGLVAWLGGDMPLPGLAIYDLHGKRIGRPAAGIMLLAPR